MAILTTERYALTRSAIAYLADSAVDVETSLAYESVLLQLDRRVEAGTLPIVEPWIGTRHAAYRTATDHLTAMQLESTPGFNVALCAAELDVVWRQEQAR